MVLNTALDRSVAYAIDLGEEIRQVVYAHLQVSNAELVGLLEPVSWSAEVHTNRVALEEREGFPCLMF